jgi:hypothetical protein
MDLVGVTDAELKAVLISKGAITKAMEIGNLPERIVTLILDGKDKKTGQENWDLIVNAVQKARAK